MLTSDLVRRAGRCYCSEAAVGDGSRRLTYRQLDEASDRVSNALAGIGLRAGDRAVIRLPNGIEWVVLDCALAKLGCLTVPLGPAVPPAEQSAILDALDPALVAVPPDAVEEVQETAAGRRLQVVVVGAAGRWIAGAITYDDLLGGQATPAGPLPAGRCPAERLVRLSSGTTGTPKGVVLSDRNWIAGCSSLLIERSRLTVGDVVLGCGPFSGAALSWVTAAIMSGAQFLAAASRRTEEIIALVRQHGVTTLQAVPTVLRRLLDRPDFNERSLPSIRTISYGSAAMDNDTALEAMEKFPGRLVQGYGLVEAPNLVVLSRQDHIAYEQRRRGSHPLGREGMLVSASVGDPCGRAGPPLIGETGELWVRGPMVAVRYWGGTPELKRPDGWLATGDLVTRDDRGLLWMVGRSKEVVISGGVTIHPTEIESVLMTGPGLRDCAVIGVPDREWGERLVAALVLAGEQGASMEGFRRWAHDALSGYKRPKEFVPIGEIPKTDNGKIKRAQIRDWYETLNQARTDTDQGDEL